MKFHISIFVLFLFLCSPFVNAQWISTSGPPDFNYSIGANGPVIFAGGSGTVYVSTDFGANWSATPMPHNGSYALVSSGVNVFTGNAGNGVYMSSNNGQSWEQRGLGGLMIHSLAVNPSGLFAGAYYPEQGVFFTTNNGLNWTATGLDTMIIYALAVSGSNVFAGTAAYGVYISTNNGGNWSKTSLNNRTVHALVASGTDIYAGTENNGVYRTTNNGQNWTQTGLAGIIINSLAATGSSVFAGTDSHGVYMSTDNGATWLQKIEGLGNLRVNALLLNGDYIFAGADVNVWKRSLSELIGITNISSQVPDNFSLYQNYPNPFNPSTKFRFSIAPPLNLPLSGGDVTAMPGTVGVKIVIYDILGREVAVLVNQDLNPGTYEVSFDASNYPSGVYFYRLQANDFTETKKMILIK